MGEQDQGMCSMDIASLCHLALGSESGSWLCLFSSKYRAGGARKLHKAYFSAEISEMNERVQLCRVLANNTSKKR